MGLDPENAEVVACCPGAALACDSTAADFICLTTGTISMVESPCIRNCCLDPQDVCLGCGRHIDEITGWHQASDDERQQIKQRAAERVQQRDALLLKRRVAARPE